MLQKKFTKTSLTALAIMSAVAYAPSSYAATTYSNNFDLLDAAAPRPRS